uniref:Uncharacterized protein n=1 Tax=Glycine max TaxID=3847 RepID=C6T6E4_SOYBN|nr:unknown [Glycine max]
MNVITVYKALSLLGHFSFASSTKISLPLTILPFMALKAFSASIPDLKETKPNPLGLLVIGSKARSAWVTSPNGENNFLSCSCVV